MSSVLNSGAEVLSVRTFFGGAPSENLRRSVFSEFSEFAHGSFNRASYRDVTEHAPGVSRRNYLVLGAVIVGLHVAAFWVYLHTPSTPYVVPHKSEVMIEFAKPVVIPPPVVEPPPPPPPPKVQRETPPPRSTPALRTPPADQNITADDMTVKENTEAPKSTSPVVADAPAAPPAPPAAPKEEPITEAFGGAGYLNNPAPEYPPAADRQGLSGKVLLKVHVLPDGSVGAIEVKKSSGYKILDNAAIKTVQGWKFNPAKRGNTPIEGNVTVPIDYQR